MVCVSHWFDSFSFPEVILPQAQKYLNDAYLNWLKSRGFSVISLSPQCTHHDAHAWSAISFFENHDLYGLAKHFDAHVIVSDGFGNRQEVVSIYEASWRDGVARLSLVSRLFGYSNSLGLMYQYATSFCSMKENQDEYKFLGYEAHISEVGVNISRLDEWAMTFASSLFKKTKGKDKQGKPDATFINTNDLLQAKTYFYNAFRKVLNDLEFYSTSLRDTRIIVGYFIQKVLESYYAQIIQDHKITNLLLAGGVHYNVKLNNFCAKQVGGLISIVPLAGDQGAAIGLYRASLGPFPLKGLLWGQRDLKRPEGQLPDRVVWTDSRDEYVSLISHALHKDQIVNTVTGAAEFGPRALCNTSTLALPFEENVETINLINGRDTIMPFAGVMLERHVGLFHKDKDVAKVLGSLNYMITTLDYSATLPPIYKGIAHSHPAGNVMTGRPQVIAHNYTGPIREILEAVSPVAQAIINTSLNIHGVPIVHTVKHAIDDFYFNMSEANRLEKRKPILIIGHF